VGHSDFQLNLRPPGKVFLICFIACFAGQMSFAEESTHDTEKALDAILKVLLCFLGFAVPNR
jgi:hypothetical protein